MGTAHHAKRIRMKRAVFVLFVVVACGESTPTKSPPPQTSASAAASATAAPTATATATADTPPAQDPACAALDDVRKAENTKLKAIAQSQDPMSRVQGMNDDVIAAFDKCTKTKSGGAWGLGLHDVKTEAATHGVSAELVVIHVDTKGQKTTLALTGTPRLKDRAFQSHDADRVAIDTQMVYDFDGDGDEEFIAIGHDQTKDGPRDPLAYIVQIKNGSAQLYPPANGLPIFRVEDFDRDGRPDFVSYGPYRSRVPARCNNAQAAQVVGPPLLIHSLPNGTFSMTDDKALAFAKQQCEKPGFTVARDDQKKVDDDQTFVNIACARLWGMSESQAVQAVARSCTAIRGEASCKESSLLSCVYPAEMTQWARAKPPLILK